MVSRLPVGGVENMLLKIVKGYDRKKFNASICCIKEGGEIADRLIDSGFKVHILNKMKGHGFDFGAVLAVYKLLKRENIHILRTHQHHANLYGRIAGMLAGVPVIIPTFHNLYRYPDKPKLHRRIFNYLLGFVSDAVVAVSNAVASDMARYDNIKQKKIKVIYNGIKEKDFDIRMSMEEARKIFNLPDGVIIIGSVGRLDEQKGHKYLINAVAELKGSHLVIAGDGPLMEELKKSADRFNVKCVFLGRLGYDKVPCFLRALDIFCFPSLWEGMPSALIEAMASGLPVVASDIAPHREVLGDTGILIPPDDTGQLAKALKILISNPSLKDSLGKKAKERAALFSIENTINDYEDLFKEILRKKGLL